MMSPCTDPVSELHLTSALADLGRLYGWLDEAASQGTIAPEVLARMHVALEEAVANVALHGFPAGTRGDITVRLHVDKAAAVLDIEDTGIAFDPTAMTPRTRTTTLDDVAPGGWGLDLIRQFCTEMSYARTGMTNQLNLRFSLAA